jgi:hypothetical protein
MGFFGGFTFIAKNNITVAISTRDGLVYVGIAQALASKNPLLT